jgi:hypothetical protein
LCLHRRHPLGQLFAQRREFPKLSGIMLGPGLRRLSRVSVLCTQRLEVVFQRRIRTLRVSRSASSAPTVPR